jgi:hypothetical protein
MFHGNSSIAVWLLRTWKSSLQLIDLELYFLKTRSYIRFEDTKGDERNA